jgi:hypothetical protein
LSNGDLAMLWSPILFVNGKYNYLVLMAKSKNNKLRGEWEFIDKPIFDKNGGHSMIFTDLKGEKKIALHINVVPETPRFLDVEEIDGELVVKD